MSVFQPGAEGFLMAPPVAAYVGCKDIVNFPTVGRIRESDFVLLFYFSVFNENWDFWHIRNVFFWPNQLGENFPLFLQPITFNNKHLKNLTLTEAFLTTWPWTCMWIILYRTHKFLFFFKVWSSIYSLIYYCILFWKKKIKLLHSSTQHEIEKII